MNSGEGARHLVFVLPSSFIESMFSRIKTTGLAPPGSSSS